MANLKDLIVQGSAKVIGKLYADLTGNVTGNLTGNASTATKATQDASGNVITTTYATKTELTNHHDSTKQDTITDLATIRAGAAKGATALQSVPAEYVTETELQAYHDSTKQDTLVSGTSIKTINSIDLLGSGNIEIKGEDAKLYKPGEGMELIDGETFAVSRVAPEYAANFQKYNSPTITDEGVITIQDRRYVRYTFPETVDMSKPWSIDFQLTMSGVSGSADVVTFLDETGTDYARFYPYTYSDNTGSVCWYAVNADGTQGGNGSIPTSGRYRMGQTLYVHIEYTGESTVFKIGTTKGSVDLCDFTLTTYTEMFEPFYGDRPLKNMKHIAFGDYQTWGSGNYIYGTMPLTEVVFKQGGQVIYTPYKQTGNAVVTSATKLGLAQVDGETITADNKGVISAVMPDTYTKEEIDAKIENAGEKLTFIEPLVKETKIETSIGAGMTLTADKLSATAYSKSDYPSGSYGNFTNPDSIEFGSNSTGWYMNHTAYVEMPIEKDTIYFLPTRNLTDNFDFMMGTSPAYYSDWTPILGKKDADGNFYPLMIPAKYDYNYYYYNITSIDKSGDYLRYFGTRNSSTYVDGGMQYPGTRESASFSVSSDNRFFYMYSYIVPDTQGRDSTIRYASIPDGIASQMTHIRFIPANEKDLNVANKIGKYVGQNVIALRDTTTYDNIMANLEPLGAIVVTNEVSVKTAGTEQLGVVKVDGTTITVSDGVISASTDYANKDLSNLSADGQAKFDAKEDKFNAVLPLVKGARVITPLHNMTVTETQMINSGVTSSTDVTAKSSNNLYTLTWTNGSKFTCGKNDTGVYFNTQCYIEVPFEYGKMYVLPSPQPNYVLKCWTIMLGYTDDDNNFYPLAVRAVYTNGAWYINPTGATAGTSPTLSGLTSVATTSIGNINYAHYQFFHASENGDVTYNYGSTGSGSSIPNNKCSLGTDLLNRATTIRFYAERMTSASITSPDGFFQNSVATLNSTADITAAVNSATPWDLVSFTTLNTLKLGYDNTTIKVNASGNIYADLSSKQDTISDLATIRSNAAKGATALQSVPSEYITETELSAYHDSTKQDTISDLATIRSNASAGKTASTTIATYGNIVTHNASEFQVAGDYATNTKVNAVEQTANDAKAIAEGKATGYVFDTKAAMDTWITAHKTELKLGDNLYIRATDVPDYWWDGTSAQVLETQKVDLSGYAKTADVVPNTRKVNNKALSADISLTASDVGAANTSLSNLVAAGQTLVDTMKNQRDNARLYDWVGTKAQYESAWSAGTIQATWRCFITDDNADLEVANTSLSNLSTAGQEVLNKKANILWYPDRPVGFYLPKYMEADKKTLTIKAKTSVTVAGNTKYFAEDTTYTLTSILDTGTALQAGKDYCVYVTHDGNVKVSLNKVAPSGYTSGNTRKIGGFHTICRTVTASNAPVIPANSLFETHPAIGYTAGDAIGISTWTEVHRPYSAADGMVYVSGDYGEAPFWADIYLQSGIDGATASAFGGTITNNRNPIAHQYDMNHVGKKLMTDSQFTIFADCSNQRTNVKGSIQPSPFTAGGHVDTADQAMISAFFGEECCGLVWQWLDEIAPTGGSAWVNYGNTARGASYGMPYVLRAGGYWSGSTYCGSWSRHSNDTRSVVGAHCGARGSSLCREITVTL